MSLPTTKTTPTSKFDLSTGIIYGAPKIGKSTLMAEIPNALFFNLENGLKHLSVYSTPVLKTWEQVVTHTTEFLTTNNPFTTVVYDSTDILYELATDHICKKLTISHPSKVGYGQAWQMINTLILKLYNRIKDHPKKEIGVFFICHEKVTEIKTKGGGTINRVELNIPDGLKKSLSARVDGIFRLTTIRVNTKDKEGKPAIEDQRVIQLRGDYTTEGGCRWGKDIPKYVPISLDSLQEVFK